MNERHTIEFTVPSVDVYIHTLVVRCGKSQARLDTTDEGETYRCDIGGVEGPYLQVLECATAAVLERERAGLAAAAAVAAVTIVQNSVSEDQRGAARMSWVRPC